MDDFSKTMAGTAVGLGSIALLGQSMKMIPTDMMQVPRARPRPIRQMRPISKVPHKRFILKGQPMKKMMGSGRIDYRKQNKRFMQGTMGIMVGVPLLSAASSMIK
ncbi:hypothetical protein M0R04_08950 [Candidatus Dojkabacteria bacterium]|jgi:hypothetical protein|nr:hypothetical protein [Candidatus Dojkabacteria bacterium]